MKKIVFVLFVFIITSCSTLVSFKSTPSDADVYLNGEYVGKTPTQERVSNFIFNDSFVMIKKEGYKTVETKLKKEIKAVPAIAGFMLLIPALWCYGPQKYQYFNLTQTSYVSDNKTTTENKEIQEKIKTVESLVLFEFESIGKSHNNNISTMIRFDNDRTDFYFYDILETHGISLNHDARLDFIKIIDKVIEWDKLAKDNKINDVKKDLPAIGGSCFFKLSDWFFTNYKSIDLSFIVIAGRSFLFIHPMKMVSRNNDFMTSNFDGVCIPIGVLPEIKRALSTENIKLKIQESIDKKQKADSIFK